MTIRLTSLWLLLLATPLPAQTPSPDEISLEYYGEWTRNDDAYRRSAPTRFPVPLSGWAMVIRWRYEASMPRGPSMEIVGIRA